MIVNVRGAAVCGGDPVMRLECCMIVIEYMD